MYALIHYLLLCTENTLKYCRALTVPVDIPMHRIYSYNEYPHALTTPSLPGVGGAGGEAPLPGAPG